MQAKHAVPIDWSHNILLFLGICQFRKTEKKFADIIFE